VITKSVQTDLVPVEVELRKQGYQITRRPVGVPVDAVPQVKYEGEVMVVPIVEERLVRQLFVTEEILIAPEITSSTHREEVELRREHVQVQRTEL